MPELEVMGRWIMVVGVVLFVAGALIWLASRIPALRDIPGTLRIQGSGFTCVIPILASIVLSIVLTVVLNLLARWFNR